MPEGRAILLHVDDFGNVDIRLHVDSDLLLNALRQEGPLSTPFEVVVPIRNSDHAQFQGSLRISTHEISVNVFVSSGNACPIKIVVGTR